MADEVKLPVAVTPVHQGIPVAGVVKKPEVVRKTRGGLCETCIEENCTMKNTYTYTSIRSCPSYIKPK